MCRRCLEADIDAGDMGINPARHVNVLHFGSILRITQNDFGWDDAGL
jgi:hypothetical protein